MNTYFYLQKVNNQILLSNFKISMLWYSGEIQNSLKVIKNFN